jgi:hypothetical protein
MRVLALDLATRSGFAVDGPNTCPPIAGTYTLASKGSARGLSFLRFSEWLYEMIGAHDVGLVAYEAPIFGNVPMNKNTGTLLIGLGAMCEMMATSRNVAYFSAHIQTVRAHFVGAGRPAKPKEAVMGRCRMLGWDVPDHNAADAAAVWAYTKARFDKGFRLEAATPLFAKGAA